MISVLGMDALFLLPVKIIENISRRNFSVTSRSPDPLNHHNTLLLLQVESSLHRFRFSSPGYKLEVAK